MKTIKRMAAQGDVLLRRVKQVPEGFTAQTTSGPLVVAHSETGHNHEIDATGVRMYTGADPLRCYLVLESVDHAELVHKRDFDTHETLCLGGGTGAVWEAIRQREYTPEGWRRASD